MKKILHIFTVSMSVVFLEDIFAYLRGRGYELLVICSDGNEARLHEKHGDYKFFPVNITRKITPLSDLIALVRIAVIIRRERPLIVHGHTPKGGLLAMLASKIMGVEHRPYHLHGLRYQGESRLKRMLIRYVERTSIKLATKVFVVSSSLREFAINDRLAAPQKLEVLLNGSIKGVDVAKAKRIREQGRAHYRSLLGVKHHDCVIGFVGRISEEKGIMELIVTTERLTESGFDVGVVICGPLEINQMSNRHYFEDYIHKSYVQYFGSVQEPMEYMVCCDIFVMPTYREGFGLVNIEANSVGVPVITTNVIGSVDSIEGGSTGIFVEPADVDSLFDAIRELAQNPELRKAMGDNGVKRTEELYDRARLWNALLDEYDFMVERGKVK